MDFSIKGSITYNSTMFLYVIIAIFEKSLNSTRLRKCSLLANTYLQMILKASEP